MGWQVATTPLIFRPRDRAFAIDQPQLAEMSNSAGAPLMELFALAVLLLFQVAAYRLESSLMDKANFITPTCLIIILGWTSFSIVRRDFANLWMPILWARLALIAYYGAGSLVPYISNEYTAAMLDAFYLAFPTDVARYNLVCCVFALVLLSTSRGTTSLLRTSQHIGKIVTWRPRSSGFSARNIGLSFLALGMIANYGFVVPHAFGFVDGLLPQVVSQIALLTMVGYYILTYQASSRNSKDLIWISALVITEMTIGVLELAKTNAILPLVVSAIGYIQGRPTSRRLLISAAAVALFYFFVAPVVTYGRAVLADTYGSIVVSASLSERWDIVSGYTPERAQALNENEIQVAWARLAYVNAGTFAINQFDAGLPGASLEYAFVSLVPRFIYPDKPNITDVGRDFNVAVTGNPNSQSSPGVPSEAYWNFGWFGVFVVSVYVGVLLTALSMYARAVVVAEAWYLIPILLISLRMGIRMDGFFVADFVGPLPIIIVAHIALTFLNNLTLKKK